AKYGGRWTVEDISEGKGHLKAHAASPSCGFVKHTVLEVLDIDNELLCSLFNESIGLESRILKLLTLMTHKCLYTWALEIGAVPPSQNGFRPGRRTNNNMFILRTMIDQARAEGKVLWTAFVDISNAFPSTNHDALWIKLHKMGATGKIFD
ncbi:hypothetical protein BDZ89DRAFT_900739, partial [Hymenopellis radicata]